MNSTTPHAVTIYRKSARMTLAEFAARVGTTKSWLSRIEARLVMPSSALIERIIGESGGKLSGNDFFCPSSPAEDAAVEMAGAREIKSATFEPLTSSPPTSLDPDRPQQGGGSPAIPPSSNQASPHQAAGRPAEATARKISAS